MYLFKNLFCSIQKIYDFLDFISRFLDVLPAFTCARAIDNL